MAAKTSADGFRHRVPLWRYQQSPATALRQAREQARRRRAAASGDPVVYVVMEWPEDEDDEQMPILGLEHC